MAGNGDAYDFFATDRTWAAWRATCTRTKSRATFVLGYRGELWPNRRRGGSVPNVCRNPSEIRRQACPRELAARSICSHGKFPARTHAKEFAVALPLTVDSTCPYYKSKHEASRLYVLIT